MDPSSFPGSQQHQPPMVYSYDSIPQQPEGASFSHRRHSPEDVPYFDQRYLSGIVPSHHPSSQPQFWQQQQHQHQQHSDSAHYLPQSHHPWSDSQASSTSQYAQQQYAAHSRQLASMSGPNLELELPSIRRHVVSSAPASTTGPPERPIIPLRQRAQRTGQACENCRGRKTKCSGSRPVCERCQARGLPCRYPESKAQARRRTEAVTSFEGHTVSSSPPNRAGGKLRRTPNGEGQGIANADPYENQFQLDQPEMYKLPAAPGVMIPTISTPDNGPTQHALEDTHYRIRPNSSSGVPSSQWLIHDMNLPRYSRAENEGSRRDLIDPRYMHAFPTTPLSTLSMASRQSSLPSPQDGSPSPHSAYSSALGMHQPRPRASSLPSVCGEDAVDQEGYVQSTMPVDAFRQHDKRVGANVREHSQPSMLQYPDMISHPLNDHRLSQTADY